MPPERGLFLETTWRLHPDLCAFTSEVFYDGRLEPEAHLAQQIVTASAGSSVPLVLGAGPRLVASPSIGADNPIPRLSKAMTSNDSRNGAKKGSPQETCVPLIPWIISSGSPEPARS